VNARLLPSIDQVFIALAGALENGFRGFVPPPPLPPS